MRETVAFAASQRAAQVAAGVPSGRADRGIASQVGLAKRQSTFHATRYVGWATILTTELPETFAALQAGEITEWRAMLVARETAWLSREDRTQVDKVIAPKLGDLGDRMVEAEARKLGCRLDPEGYVARSRSAAHDRRVGVRPAPDTMSRLTVLVPVAQGVAGYAALKRHADSLIGQGDARTSGQIMADTAIERITGQAQASDVPVEIHLVMTDEALFGNSMPEDIDLSGAAADEDGTDVDDTDDLQADPTSPAQPAGRNEPAYLHGFGPIPAGVARDLIFGVRKDTPQWIRRLFIRPRTGELVATESRRRCFTAAQRQFLELADQVCRTPWCGAPIRHIDHVRPAARGGPTVLRNGQGYCAACNYAKQAPGWHGATTARGSRDGVMITTPTGHRYRSRPPDPPGVRFRVRAGSTPLERRATRLLARAAA